MKKKGTQAASSTSGGHDRHESAALNKIRKWDPKFADIYSRMSTNPWTNGILPLKHIELICVALETACTKLNEEGARAHIRAALRAGATREEIIEVLKMASLLAIHSCSLGAPILLEEAKAAGAKPTRSSTPVPTPICDKVREVGQWNDAWDPFVELDPAWTDQFMAAGIPVFVGGVFSPKLVELLSIALDASVTHMYPPGTRRHIRAALALGATIEEIMEVLKLCVINGSSALNLGVSILEDELGD
ncbi:MAG TPA: carboxymuconolactone decarboxylase family protein [Candidatus Binataceae bacterium]|nr:carboxymuconolactone decarboxylase family protein [Candidatus Binataceae bacterium]